MDLKKVPRRFWLYLIITAVLIIAAYITFGILTASSGLGSPSSSTIPGVLNGGPVCNSAGLYVYLVDVTNTKNITISTVGTGIASGSYLNQTNSGGNVYFSTCLLAHPWGAGCNATYITSFGQFYSLGTINITPITEGILLFKNDVCTSTNSSQFFVGFNLNYSENGPNGPYTEKTIHIR